MFAVVMGIGWYIFTAPKEGERTESVFVYGTLQNPVFRAYACYCYTEGEKVTLDEYEKVNLNILPNPDEQVSGKIIKVSKKELERIDRYEDVPSNYRREQISIDDRIHWVYFKN